MRHPWVLLWVPALACSSSGRESITGRPASGSPSVSSQGPNKPSVELIPAEWTVSEDTSATGEVTTASVQLPAAKDISGLLEDQGPRLILRCVDGKVEASIEIESSAETVSEPDTGLTQRVAIQLDSAPSCE